MESIVRLRLLGTVQVERNGEPVRGFRSRKALALLGYLAVQDQPVPRERLADLFWGDRPEVEGRANLSWVLHRISTLLPGCLRAGRHTVQFQRTAPSTSSGQAPSTSSGQAPSTSSGQAPSTSSGQAPSTSSGQAPSTGSGQAPSTSSGQAPSTSSGQAPSAGASTELGEVSGQAPYWLDIDSFRELEAQGGAASLAAAAELCRGEFLEGLCLEGCAEFELWLVGERERWRQRVARVLGELVAHHTRRGEYDEGLRFARRLLTLTPWREKAHRQTMLLLARSGQRSAALAQYETCRRILAEELGVEPTEETTALYQRIRSAGSPRPHNLPAQTTSFIGRERELAQVAGLLADLECRLLTLVGPGGVGKTRLALEAALRATVDRSGVFPHGVYLVSLAPLRSTDFLVPTIAKAVGCAFHPGTDPQTQLLSYLREKELLLLLDSFDPLLAAGPLVADLLAACPRLMVLVTSREPLHVRGERRFPVPPLALPDLARLPPPGDLLHSPAVALFVDRAQAVRPGFAVTGENGAAVAEICVRLDGLPLAIELAAARSRLLPPQMMLPRLASRLALLVGGAWDLPARQRTLRGTIDWSHDLLTRGEKETFARLAVFAGGCTMEAIGSVCSVQDPRRGTVGGQSTEVEAIIQSLLDKSLLQRQETAGGEARFTMLETIHEYGLERLIERGELETLQDRHAAYYLGLAGQAEAELRGPQQMACLARLGVEYDNLRAALVWLLRGQKPALSEAEGSKGPESGGRDVRFQTPNPELGARLVAALVWFWIHRGDFNEARQWLEEALARLDSEPRAADPSTMSLRAKLLYGVGGFAWGQGDYALALARLEESVAVGRESGDEHGLAHSLALLGMEEATVGDYAQAHLHLDEGIALFREMGDRWGLAWSLNHLGWSNLLQSNYPEARSLFEESLAIWRQLGDRWAVAVSLGNLGHMALVQGDYAAAQSLLKETLAIKRELRDRWWIALLLCNLGCVALGQGDCGRAAALFKESLILSEELGDKRTVFTCLAGMAGVLDGQGQPERAVRLLGAVGALCEALEVPLMPAGQVAYDHVVTIARTRLDEATFAEGWAQGQTMTVEQAVACGQSCFHPR